MGVINLTPDSFSDGGLYQAQDRALKRACELVEAGAHILDFGGASSRPQASMVDCVEELKRVYPILSRVRSVVPSKVIISVDTYSPVVAHALAQEGLVDLINDIFAGQREEIICSKTKLKQNTAQIAAHFQLGYVVMHMQGVPSSMQDAPLYQNCVQDVFAFLKERICYAESVGVPFIIADPGIGFGKTVEDNLALLTIDAFQTLLQLKKPLLIGLSRKSFFEKLYLGLSEPISRDRVSKKYELRCLKYGARIVRSHMMPSEVDIHHACGCGDP
jgi:dihydropteroate synthase